MARYEYRCPADGLVEVARPIGTASDEIACPVCGEAAVRVLGAPLFSRASPAARVALDRAERSRDVPDLVTTVPGAPPRRPVKPVNPATSRLPRP